MTKPFLVCVHDATPAYARETRVIIRELTPLVGRRFSFAVVPDWHGEWPLAAHPEYCQLIRESAEELLLHGWRHQRRRGWGPVALFAGPCDEMNGLDGEQTEHVLARAQQLFTDAFSAPARGFLAPAWQRGRVTPERAGRLGLDHIAGFFALQSRTGRTIPLATWTWDCGRWGWSGHAGHALGSARHLLAGGVPTLAIHPVDLARGFWPRILRMIRDLLDTGHEPGTLAALLEANDVAIRA
jgi:hypothetical protein